MNWRLFGLCCSLLLICSGCLKLDEQIQIRRDGSARIEISYSLPVKYAALLSDAEGASRQITTGKTQEVQRLPLSRLFDHVKMREHFQQFKGVEVDNVIAYSKEGRRHCYIKLEVKDLSASLKQKLLPHRSLMLDGEDYRFRCRTSVPTGKASESLKSLLKGASLRLKVRTPGRILSSNGEQTSGNIVVWHYEGGEGKKSICKAPEIHA